MKELFRRLEELANEKDIEWEISSRQWERASGFYQSYYLDIDTDDRGNFSEKAELDELESLLKRGIEFLEKPVDDDCWDL